MFALARSLSSIVLALLGLVLLMSSPASTKMILRSRKAVYELPTYDYFQVDTPNYNSSGVLINPNFDNSLTCTYIPQKPLPPPPPGIPADFLKRKFNSTIVLTDMNDATANGGCRTLAQIAAACAKFADSFEPAGFPSLSVLVIALARTIENIEVSGGPNTEVYRSSSANIPDGTPAVTVALIPSDQFFIMYDAVNDAIKSLTLPPVTVIREKGPWNEAFLNLDYIAFIWIIVAVNTFFVLHGLYRVGYLVLTKHFKLEQRNFVFALGLVAAILYSISLTLQIQTLRGTLLFQISGFMFACAFYSLLLIWATVLSAVKQNQNMLVLKGIVILALCLQSLSFIAQACFTLAVTNVTAGIMSVCRYLVPSAQLLAAAAFIYYGMSFIVRRRQYRSNKETTNALAKLSRISIAGFVGFIAIAIGNLLVADFKNASTVSTVMASNILVQIASTIRTIALLLILGVRIPDSARNGGSSHITGGWSRGWRKAFGGRSLTESGNPTGGSTMASGMSSNRTFVDPPNPKKLAEP